MQQHSLQSSCLRRHIHLARVNIFHSHYILISKIQQLCPIKAIHVKLQIYKKVLFRKSLFFRKPQKSYQPAINAESSPSHFQVISESPPMKTHLNRRFILPDLKMLCRCNSTELRSIHALEGGWAAEEVAGVGDIHFVFDHIAAFFKAVDIAAGVSIVNCYIIA